jgi:L-asparaginase II
MGDNPGIILSLVLPSFTILEQNGPKPETLEHMIPNVRVFRGGICENVHFASTLVCSKTGKLQQMFPETQEGLVYLRSAAKPFQAYPLYQNIRSKGITLKEWAIILASHAATAEQIALVEDVLEKAGVGADTLQCGAHAPIDEAMTKQLICSNQPPTAIHNNCSGKHAGMLLACRYYGWPLESYLEPDHPLQQAIVDTLKCFAGESEMKMAIDGCGAPVFAMPMLNLARLYSALAVDARLRDLCQAMLNYPNLIGDARRVDSQLMKVSEGALVAKVGAEGFLGVGNLSTGEGLVLKVHDGNNTIRDLLIIDILADLAWLTPAQSETLSAQPQFSKTRVNTQEKSVGHVELNLPWV